MALPTTIERPHAMPASARTLLRLCFAALLVAALAACDDGGEDGDEGSADATEDGSDGDGDDDPVELSFWLHGEFGYEPLIEQYEEDNPHVTITQQFSDFDEHHDALTAALAAGSGGPDISAVDVDFLPQYVDNADRFENLYDYGAGDIADQYLDWRWQQGVTADGDTVIGIPTDVGGMAMVYRHDLFEEAGLPTDRDEVSEAWSTWDDFLALGQDYVDATGNAFVDNVSQLYNAAARQSTQMYYDADNNVIIDDNPHIKESWDLATRASELGLSAGTDTWSAEWNAGMSEGTFAVLPAPAWMMGHIQGEAPDTEGLWDVADLPEGGGNWGGSQLVIPAQSDNADEAYRFIEWLLAPEQQLAVFVETGNFPTTYELYDTDEIQDHSSSFFNDAPVGPIYSESAQAVEPIQEGPQTGQIRQILENGLQRVQEGTEPADEAWNSVVEEVRSETD